MKVIQAQTAGFCWGVRRAVDRVKQLSAEADGKTIYTDGPLIHNEEMAQELKSEGVTQATSPEEARDSTLVIRAHGVTPARRNHLRSIPARLVDATCPDVAKIQGAIKKYSGRGAAIVVFGDEGHAEVTGLLGYAQGDRFVVSSAADVTRLPKLQNVCLVSQSTQFPDQYREIAEAVTKRFPDATVLDTICHATKSRQAELIEIAKNADVLVVVGGTHSANTLRLVELARTMRPTLHIQVSSQLNPTDFEPYSCVGLTAGASTPDFVIQDVRRVLNAM